MFVRVVRLSGLVALFATACGGSTVPPDADAQPPPIGIIDLYGRRQVLETDIRGALGIAEGQAAPDDAARRAARERLVALPGVRNARFEIVCCDDSGSILYVGIEEDGAPVWTFGPKPTGDVRLPDLVVKAGAEYEDVMMRAVLAGRTGQEVTQGHALSEDSTARAFEEQFAGFAAQHLDLLRRVLRESADDTQRALAAQVIAYAADKRAVIADLVNVANDPFEDVRNNAIRALGVIAVADGLPADVRRAVPAAPFVRLLNSPIWSDRNKALMLLDGLSSGRDPELVAALRRDAGPSLAEMARWKSEGHALAAFILVGRLAGLGDEDIFAAWEAGEREGVIAAARIAVAPPP